MIVILHKITSFTVPIIISIQQTDFPEYQDHGHLHMLARPVVNINVCMQMDWVDLLDIGRIVGDNKPIFRHTL